MPRSLVATAFLLLAALSAFAQLGRHKTWIDSPEAYFITAEERQQWQVLTDEAAAETFIADYRARRGGDKFTAELKKRVEMADKYLTIGNVKGSDSLRGKLVILFGAPANIAVSDRVAKSGYTSGPSTAAVSDLGTGVTAQSADGTSQRIGSGQPGRAFRDFTFTFPASAAAAFNGKDYVVSVEADAGTGKDRLGKGMKQKDVDAMIEAVAKASIKQ